MYQVKLIRTTIFRYENYTLYFIHISLVAKTHTHTYCFGWVFFCIFLWPDLILCTTLADKTPRFFLLFFCLFNKYFLRRCGKQSERKVLFLCVSCLFMQFFLGGIDFIVYVCCRYYFFLYNIDYILSSSG